MKSWFGELLRNLAQRIDPEDPEMLSVRDMRKELSPGALVYVEQRFRMLNGC